MHYVYIHYIIISLGTDSGLFAWISPTVLSRINDSGLFAWISPTALSPTILFILIIIIFYSEYLALRLHL